MILGIFKVDKRFQRIAKRKSLRVVFKSLGIELLFVPAKLEGEICLALFKLKSFLTKDEDDFN